MVKTVRSGELNYQIEIFQKEYTKNNTGESVTSLTSIGKRFAKRSADADNANDDDGAVRSINECDFIVRFENMYFTNSTNLVVRDFTGDFEVTGVEVVGYGRKRFVQLKGVRRG